MAIETLTSVAAQSWTDQQTDEQTSEHETAEPLPAARTLLRD